MKPDNATHDQIEQRLSDIDWAALTGRPFMPSPAAWEDQFLYFLMLDRFSDGREKGFRDNSGNPDCAGVTPLFSFPDDAYRANRDAWAARGNLWLGGNLTGLKSKIGYLKRLGVSAVWISPIFKQPPFDRHSYHGYGIQNFLDVDPRFGSRQDLRDLVDEAHQHGIYVILDIILNHAGDVFGYQPDRHWTENKKTGQWFLDPRWDGRPFQPAGFRNAFGENSLPFGPVDLTALPHAWPNDAVWPAEFQQPGIFSCQGKISNWDHDPEYLEGDFETLKDIHLGCHDRDREGKRIIDSFHPSPALKAICDAYRFWIAYADIDGFRVDTVKHMEIGATRYFAAVIHEFAQSLGKENFYLIGEITGGRERAVDTMEQTGLDAALGIDDVQDRLEYLVKGYRNPEEYFGLFRNSVLINKSSHVWFGRHVVTMIDDHDQVRKGQNKARFCGDKTPGNYRLLLAAVALNLTSMGIPCLYYGTEQGFDGAGDNDRFLRECMFGGDFGSLQSTGRHFFNDEHELYREIAAISAIRRQRIGLRRGRQYLRQISASGEEGSFGPPRLMGGRMRSIVAWSRIFNDQEILLAINTDPDAATSAWATIDNDLHAPGETLACLYSTDRSQVGKTVEVMPRNGKAVWLTIPPAGFVIYEQG